MKIRTIIGIIIVSGFISAGLFFYPGANDNHNRDQRLQTGYHWIQGAKQRYRLSIASDVNLLLPGSSAPLTLIQHIEGNLDMRVFAVEKGRIRLGFQLDHPLYTLNDQSDEILLKGLTAPFVADFDPSGRAIAFQFTETLQETAQIILEETIRTFQVIIPEGSKPSWSVTEKNATGRYLASYQIRKDGSIEKVKTRYTDTAMTSGNDDSAEEIEAQVIQSSAVSRISSATAWIHEAVIHETLTLSGESDFSTESDMTAKLENVPFTSDMGNNALFAASNSHEMLIAFSMPASKQEMKETTGETSSAIVSYVSIEQLAGLVEQLNTAEKGERIPLLKSIENALKKDPELAFWLMEQVELPGMTGATNAWLIHLLERAGTTQAQEALVEVMDDPSYRTWNRIRAIVALGGIDNSTEEVITSLTYISRNRNDADSIDLANASLLALGSIGKTLQKSNPQRAESIKENLITTLMEAIDFSETGVVIKAMENLGDPGLAETVIPYLHDDSPFVRSAAARTLGRIQGEEHLGLLTDQLAIEQNRTVRTALISGIEGIGPATPNSLETVNQMVLFETETGARFHMAKYLGNNLVTFPEGRKALQILALKDPSSRVRSYARSVLRQY